MSTIALPSWFGIDGFSMWLETNQRSFEAPFGGSEQVIDLLNDRWMVSLSVPPRIFPEAAGLEAFIASLRGMSNTVALHHFLRPQPRGTMRATPTAQATASGSNALLVNTTPGATLLAGDMIGISGLLLQASLDTSANGAGVMVVSLVNHLRTSIEAGTPVIWDRPTALFRLISRPVVQFVPGYAQSVAFDFKEAIG